MRNTAVLIIFIAMMLPGRVFGQIYQQDPSFGKDFNRVHIKTALGVPGDTVAPVTQYQGKPHLATKGGNTLYIWDTTAKKYVIVSGGGSSGWGLTGNVGTNPVNHFVGTIDEKSLKFRTNNIYRGEFDSAGNFNLESSLMFTGNPGNAGDFLISDGADSRPNWTEPISAISPYAWSLTGNIPADSASSFIGTTNTRPINFRTNNQVRAIISSTGNFGVGTTTPSYKFDLNGTLRLKIGTEANGYYLRSNADGVASWQPLPTNLQSLQNVTDVGLVTDDSIGVKSIYVNGNYPSSVASIRLVSDPSLNQRAKIESGNPAIGGTGGEEGVINFATGNNPVVEIDAGENNNLYLHSEGYAKLYGNSTSGVYGFDVLGDSTRIFNPKGYVGLDSLQHGSGNIGVRWDRTTKRLVLGEQDITNIYNANGTLTANRTVTGANKSLTLSGVSAFTSNDGTRNRILHNSDSTSLISETGNATVTLANTAFYVWNSGIAHMVASPTGVTLRGDNGISGMNVRDAFMSYTMSGTSRFEVRDDSAFFQKRVSYTSNINGTFTQNSLVTKRYVDSTVSASGGGITGSGTASYIPKFTGSTALGNSKIYEDGSGNIGIGTTTPATTVEIVNNTGGSFNYCHLRGTQGAGTYWQLQAYYGAVTFSSNGTITYSAGSTGHNFSGKVGTSQATPNSALHTTSFATALASKSADYTIGADDYTILVTATGRTITLPTAASITGRIYTIKLTASGTGTVATTSSQTIDGSTTYSLSAQYKYVTVQSDGSNWHIIANN